LKRIQYPSFDQHIAVSLPYAERNAAGMPEAEALARLRAAEDDLRHRLGDSALLAAHETAEGLRTFHFYSDSEDPRTTERSKAWVEKCEGATFDIAADPGWRAVAPYS
jgi:hypothetical protein